MNHADLERILLPRWTDLIARVTMLKLTPEEKLPESIEEIRKVLIATHAEIGALNGTLNEERFPAKRLTLEEVMEQATR